MQKIKKIHAVDFEKNASEIDGQTDRQINRSTGLILQDPFYKDGGLIKFSGNSRIKFC